MIEQTSNPRQERPQEYQSVHVRSWPGIASTPPSPTHPLHYAVLETAFLSALASVAMLTRRRDRAGLPEIPRAELPVLAVATFALANIITKEKISTWLREPFVQESSEHKPINAEGTGLRYAVGELLTCSRCIGAWSALGLVGMRTVAPAAGRSTATILALTGANSVMQCAYRLLTAQTDEAAQRPEAAPSRASGS